jgi:D-ribose pyranase
MIRHGLLNPHLLSLLARVRHTNLLVIADRGFPFWPMIETIDLSLVDGVPTVLQVLAAVRENFAIGQAFMAEEFLAHNEAPAKAAFAAALQGIDTTHEPHEAKFKKRVPGAIGLIRTGDTIPYANVILVSA